MSTDFNEALEYSATVTEGLVHGKSIFEFTNNPADAAVISMRIQQLDSQTPKLAGRDRYGEILKIVATVLYPNKNGTEKSKEVR